jgi:hypothetical protein
MCLNKGKSIYSLLKDMIGKEAPEHASCRPEREDLG